MEHLARILNDLHRAFGTITDVSVLARLRTYDEIGIGPIVTAADRDALMLAVKQKQWVTAGGQKISLKADGRAVLAFVNAYRDRYNALWSDMVSRESVETELALYSLIAHKIVKHGETDAKEMLIEMSKKVDDENARFVEAFQYTRANLVQVLAQRFHEYDGEKPLRDHIREHYKPLGPEQADIINKAYLAAKRAINYEKP